MVEGWRKVCLVFCSSFVVPSFCTAVNCPMLLWRWSLLSRSLPAMRLTQRWFRLLNESLVFGMPCRNWKCETRKLPYWLLCALCVQVSCSVVSSLASPMMVWIPKPCDNLPQFSARRGLQNVSQIEKLQEPLLEALQVQVKMREYPDACLMAKLLMMLPDIRSLTLGKPGLQD